MVETEGRSMDIKKEQSNGVCVLYVSGVLDYSTMGLFVNHVGSIEKEISKVIVDFTDLEFIDSTGIGAIVNLFHEAYENDFDVELQGIEDEVKELFDTVGVFQILESLQKGSD